MDIAASSYQLPYDRLPFFSKLFVDYCTQYDKLASYYAGPFFSDDAIAQRAKDTLAFSRNRALLADVLLEQNARWELDEATRANIEHLRNPQSLCVITGQQVGLFAGPLYTPYKILTAILLAKKWSGQLGQPVVPVFWIADEDHDFAEIAAFSLLDRDDSVQTFHYDHPIASTQVNTGPVGRLPLSSDITRLLDLVGPALKPGLYTDDVMTLAREVYQPGRSLADACALMVRRLFPDAGLIIVSPDDAGLKSELISLFEQELRNPQVSSSILEKTSAELDQQYHAQVKARPTNLFVMDPEGRLPLDAENGRIQARHTTMSWSPEEAVTVLHESPARFSPNVVLRPIAQDRLFPTLAYVAGPGETAYFAQYREIYEWAGVPMPLIYPRISLTLVDPAIQRVMDKLDLPLPAYAEDPNILFKRRVIEALDPDVVALFEKTGAELDGIADALKETATSVESTLEKTAEAYRAGLAKKLGRFKEQIIKAEKKKKGIERERIRRIHAHLFPKGKPQERVLSPLHVMNRFGIDIFSSLAAHVSLNTREHTVLTIQ